MAMAALVLVFLVQAQTIGRAAPGGLSTTSIASGWRFWPSDGVPLCAANRNQEHPAIISDGAGGAIVAWEDYRDATSPYGPTDIYAQRVTSDGLPAWTLDGIAISLAPEDQVWVQMIGDGEGGAIVAWQDGRSGTADIYAQRVTAGGEAVWATDGILLCSAAGDQYTPTMVPDGTGGAIVAWGDYRNGGADIYAQRVNWEGRVDWNVDGVPLTAAIGDQVEPVATSDCAGGAIVAWFGSYGAVQGIGAQRVNSDGTLAWAGDGVWLSQSPGFYPRITDDGSGGAIVAWQSDYGDGADIYAQRVLSDGTVAWTENGAALCLAPGNQVWPVLVGDGAGGAIVAWQDERNGESVPLVYAQRIESDGTVAWASDGIRVATGGGVYQWYPAITSDGEGGAILTWRGATEWLPHIYAQRLHHDGALLWGVDSLLVCGVDEGEGQDLPHLAANGAGGAIVVWEDNRRWYKKDELDVYVQRIGERARTYLPLAARDSHWGQR